MRTTLQNWTLLFGSAVSLAFPAAASAQALDIRHRNAYWRGDHVGNVTGHAKDAALPYRPVTVFGCHGPLGDGNGKNADWFLTPMYQSHATSSWASSSAAPLHRNLAHRPGSFRRHHSRL